MADLLIGFYPHFVLCNKYIDELLVLFFRSTFFWKTWKLCISIHRGSVVSRQLILTSRSMWQLSRSFHRRQVDVSRWAHLHLEAQLTHQDLLRLIFHLNMQPFCSVPRGVKCSLHPAAVAGSQFLKGGYLPLENTNNTRSAQVETRVATAAWNWYHRFPSLLKSLNIHLSAHRIPNSCIKDVCRGWSSSDSLQTVTGWRAGGWGVEGTQIMEGERGEFLVLKPNFVFFISFFLYFLLVFLCFFFKSWCQQGHRSVY